MKISIAMATYNGAQYLREQLESFMAQSLPPDELIVCDDNSNDGTVAILREFALIADFPIRITINPLNLGFVQNFALALSLCSGDIIFLSDQDDVWYPEKIEVMVSELERSSGCLLAVNDVVLANEHLVPTRFTLLNQVRAIGSRDRDLVIGCATVIRREFLSVALPIPDGAKDTHDGWLHDLAHCLDVRKIVPRTLQIYRRHSSNTSQPIAAALRRVTWKDDHRNYRHAYAPAAYSCAVQRLQVLVLRLEQCLKHEDLFEAGQVKHSIDSLRLEEAALRRRAELLRHSRIARAWPALRNYIRGDYRFFRGWKSFAKDLVRH
jgi:glycosyltransferase involved in cell wall biosynthesis